VKDIRRTSPLPRWYQLIVKSKPVKIAQATKTGINPFDEDVAGKYRCPSGILLDSDCFQNCMLNAVLGRL